MRDQVARLQHRLTDFAESADAAAQRVQVCAELLADVTKTNCSEERESDSASEFELQKQVILCELQQIALQLRRPHLTNQTSRQANVIPEEVEETETEKEFAADAGEEKEHRAADRIHSTPNPFLSSTPIDLAESVKSDIFPMEFANGNFSNGLSSNATQPLKRRNSECHRGMSVHAQRSNGAPMSEDWDEGEEMQIRYRARTLSRSLTSRSSNGNVTPEVTMLLDRRKMF